MSLKSVVRKFSYLINYNPFINAINIRGTKLTLSSHILVGCKIKTKGKGNIICFHGDGGFKNTHINIVGNNNTVEFAKGVSMDGGTILLEGDNNSFIVGKNTKFCGKIHIAIMESTKLQIGESGLFSSDIIIRTGDSHSVVDLSGKRINTSKDITLGDHIWVGNHVIITKGSAIGNNCVIGTGAVVTHGWEENNVIIAGVPAKIVKRDIDWRPERI